MKGFLDHDHCKRGGLCRGAKEKRGWRERGGRGGMYALRREREVQEKRESTRGDSWSMTKERKKLIKK